jgi:hypothetical protein
MRRSRDRQVRLLQPRPRRKRSGGESRRTATIAIKIADIGYSNAGVPKILVCSHARYGSSLYPRVNRCRSAEAGTVPATVRRRAGASKMRSSDDGHRHPRPGPFQVYDRYMKGLSEVDGRLIRARSLRRVARCDTLADHDDRGGLALGRAKPEDPLSVERPGTLNAGSRDARSSAVAVIGASTTGRGCRYLPEHSANQQHHPNRGGQHQLSTRLGTDGNQPGITGKRPASEIRSLLPRSGPASAP